MVNVLTSANSHRRTRSSSEDDMANHLRWDDIKKERSELAPAARAGIERDLALGQLIYDLRTASGLSQRGLAERMGVTDSDISRLEEGGGANQIDILARVTVALDRHLIVWFPEKVPARLKDAVQIT